MPRSFRQRFRLVALGSILPLVPSFAPGQVVTYEIRPPSALFVSCPVCRFAPLEPLSGSFVLTAVNAGATFTDYELSALEIQGPPGSGRRLRGAGTYRLQDGVAAPSQEMILDLTEGEETIRLRGRGAAGQVWPVISVDLVELLPGELMHSLRLVAAPRTEYVEYRLEEGSEYIEACTTCRRLPLVVPLSGTFLLGTIDQNPLFTTFRLDTMDLQGALGELSWQISGQGRYRQGGEVALTQDLELEVLVRSPALGVSRALRLESEDPSVPAVLPKLRAEASLLDESGPEPYRYTVRLVASPSTPVEYRRGDSNGDGRVDLSDGVRVLAWLLLGEAAPECLDAADANADAQEDLSDAISILGYLFLGGEPPPAPGPDSCGAPPKRVFGCANYPTC